MGTPKIEIPASAWEQTGPDEDKGARLLAQIHICGTAIHLEAYAIDVSDGTQRFSYADYFEQEEHAFYLLAGGATDTTPINGREYVLVAHPHGA